MAVVRFEKEYVYRLLSKKDLESLPNLGVQVENKEEQIEFEINPDRPDLLSIYGLKRMVEVYKTKKPRKYKLESKKIYGDIVVDDSVKDLRPFIVGAVVKDVVMTEEDLIDLMQFQEKIHLTFGRKRKKIAVGLHDLDTIEFPLKYYKSQLNKVKFIPLDETKEMNSLEIVEKTEKGIKYAELTKNNEGVFLEDQKGIVSFPPIINAERTRLKPGKRNIFIDMTGTDEKALVGALNITLTLLAEMGGKIHPIKIGKITYPDLDSKKYKLPTKFIKTFIDKKLSKKETEELLNSMGFELKKDYVLPPTYRIDIIGPVDIAEDMLIAYGYDNITPTFPKISTVGEGLKDHCFHDILTGLGFMEIMTWTLTNKEKLAMCRIKLDKLLEIINPPSEDCTLFRPLLMPGIMGVLAESKKISMPHKIYEIGTVVEPERKILGAAMCYPGATFSHISSVVQSLIKESGKEIHILPHEDTRFIEGRCAILIHEKIAVGIFGEVHPEIIDNFGIEQPVLYLETELW